MRAHLIEALKRRKSDEGFSLIELIVVVAIMAILVAIAIPVFGGIQQTAKDNSLKTAAANGATVVASQIAQQIAPANLQAELTKSNTDDYELTISAPTTIADIDISNFCVKAVPTADGSLTGGADAYSGPDCPDTP